MLGDQADKPKATIRSAMKRKKAKTVQFAAPTYVDYSEIDYSSEEEDAQAAYPAQQQQQQQAKQTQKADVDAEAEDESAKVEPLKPRSVQKDARSDSKKQEEAENRTIASRSSEELLEPRTGDGPKKTSDGTVRDSFFKDDTVETKKITLTPNLLRDDDAPRTSSDSKELKQRISFDKLDKEAIIAKDDKKKRDKKEKDKKPSAIRSFFSRKDKKNSRDEDDDSYGRRDSHDREAHEEEEVLQTTPERAPAPQRQPSKLQKQMPRTEPSPTRKPNNTTREGGGMDIKSFLSDSKVNNVANVPPASMRLVESSPKASPDSSPRDFRSNQDQSPGNSRARAQNGDMRSQKAKQARSRMELDDFDTTDEEEEDMMSPEPELSQNTAPPVVQQVRQQQPQQQRPYTTQGDGYQNIQSRSAGPPPQQQQPQPQPRVSPESSPTAANPSSNNPPPLIVDTSSQEENQSPSPRSTPSPTELLNEHDEDADTSGIKDSVATTVSSPRTSWNDASLRAFFDSGSDIRDLLVVVYDKSTVDPVDVSNHPVAGSLFREQNAKLAEITTVS